MNGSRKLFLVLACAGSMLACGSSDKKAPGGPCVRGELEACGTACDDTGKSCPAGLACEAGACNAECAPATEVVDCGADEACSAVGQCVAKGGANAGGANAGGASAGSTGDGGDDLGACGEVALKATPTTPNVILIIDQSSSMEARFGNTGSRWDVLKASLLAEDGLIAELQSLVRFGLVLYSSKNGGPTCPNLTKVDVAIDNLEAIRAKYQPADLIEDTPTGDSLDAITTQIEGTALLDGGEPTIYVLATDGEPDTCEQPDPENGQGEAIAAVKRAFDRGIRTYVIAVADERDISTAHLRDMANAGVGTAPGKPDAPSFRVNNDAGLRSALKGIVGGELSCVVPLKGKVVSKDPCVGSVRLDGQPLECNGVNGWKLVTESSIEVTGTACDTLKTGKTLEATFPCDAAIVI